MKETGKDFYWYWFVNIRGIGNITRKKLIERFAHPEIMFRAREEEFRDILTIKQRKYLMESRNVTAIHQSLSKLKERNIRFIHWESDEYPMNLRHIFDPPYGLYLIGRMPDPDKPVLSMVGSRNATIYGRKNAEYFARTLVGYGVQIISGLAAGIDGASHRGALAGGGFTLGVLGGGIDTIYPRENFNLYMEMYEKGGVLSEYNLGVANHAGLFPARNRLISGLADGVLVLEMGASSGASITVDQALEQGKDVFALPGRITDPLSVGCNRLIAQGAYSVEKPEDILQVLMEKRSGVLNEPETMKKDNIGRMRRLPLFQTEEQKNIFQLLDELNPKTFDMLLRESGYNIGTLQHILFEMELLGWIYQPTQNSYLIKFL